MDCQNLVLIAPGVVVLYICAGLIVSSIEAHQFMRAKGCLPPAKVPQAERIIGYGLYKTIKSKQGKKTSLEEGLKRTLSSGYTASAVVMGQHVITTADPENIKAILATNFKDFGLGQRIDAFGPFLGSGIFTADGIQWQHSRALIRPSFTKAQLAQLETIETHIQNLLARIPTDGSTVDLQPLFFNFTLDSASEFLFGHSINSQLALEGSESQAFSRAFDMAQAHLLIRVRIGRFRALLRETKFRDACKIVHGFADKYIAQALERPPETAKLERYNLLNELVKETTDPTQLRNELLSVMLAARDTTASLLSSVFHALARNPRVWHKLREEVDALGGSLPDYTALKDMQYLKSVLNETLRLFPPVPVNIRYATTHTTLPCGGGADGKAPAFVPKGTMMHFSVYSIHRLPAVYGPNANDFFPERWAADAEGGPLRPGWAFVPFNGGPRICVGQQLALTEASYTIVRLMQTFRKIENCDPGPWREKLALVLTSSEGTKVALKL
ncbi:uncharacterized protein K452DRAFT_349808 [Aplosporella prunicola CBS 121167]|uniref:Cytochrome P450 n=1 Tax=Aplosporella prunicola CBS 121167 TaxID=1176127 RepID=A0A6A6BLB2_9PEZI|nr:uncharacterized protein K452DRAFT_349808 [Aplosporella prunicola CBS 121167]KAF2144836.1 hypothetical protein K452DRAFT_349808 [Aplosporella prunicola CBS 121167]